MHRRIALLVAAGLPAMLLAASPASATHGYDLPMSLHGGEASGPFWVAYKVKTNGAGVTTHFNVNELTLPSQLGAMIYKGDTLYFGITQTFLAGYNGALADVNVVPDNPVHFEFSEASPTFPWTRAAMNMNGFGTPNPYKGELTFVWWIAGGNAGVTHSLDAENNGVSMTGGRMCPPEATSCAYGTGWESGTDTFVYSSEDFAGPANVKAGVGSVAARVNLATARSVTIDGTLIGAFHAFAGHADRLEVDRPAGGRVECPLAGCWFTNVDQARAGSGTYTFHATGAGAGPWLTGFGELVVGGADLRLPA